MRFGVSTGRALVFVAVITLGLNFALIYRDSDTSWLAFNFALACIGGALGFALGRA